MWNYLLSQLKNTSWNDESAKAKIRVLNYGMAVIIMMGLWVAGQATRNPSKEAYGDILAIARLPIWKTMGSNNNNNDWHPNQTCANLYSLYTSKSQETMPLHDELEALVQLMNQTCGTGEPCMAEKSAYNAAWEKCNDEKWKWNTALAAFAKWPSSRTFGALNIQYINWWAAFEDLRAASHALSQCMQTCRSIVDQIESKKEQIRQKRDEIDDIYMDLVANSCIDG